MACPHVSAVVALGISYATKLRKHFKASELKDMLHETARPIEQFWDFSSLKQYYKFVVDLGEAHLSTMDLRNYKGKMGNLVDAGALLKAIDGSGRDMRLPNLYLAPDESVTLELTYYNIEDAESVKVGNSEIAKAVLEGNTLTITAKSEGQTTLTIEAEKSYTATITVRKGANDNGWL